MTTQLNPSDNLKSLKDDFFDQINYRISAPPPDKQGFRQYVLKAQFTLKDNQYYDETFMLPNMLNEKETQNTIKLLKYSVILNNDKMLNAAVPAWDLWKSRDNGGNIQELGALMWQHMSEASPYENHQEYVKDLLETVQEIATAVGYTGQDPEELIKHVKIIKEFSNSGGLPKLSLPV